jgi:hypothetical protein
MLDDLFSIRPLKFARSDSPASEGLVEATSPIGTVIHLKETVSPDTLDCLLVFVI